MLDFFDKVGGIFSSGGRTLKSAGRTVKRAAKSDIGRAVLAYGASIAAPYLAPKVVTAVGASTTVGIALVRGGTYAAVHGATAAITGGDVARAAITAGVTGGMSAIPAIDRLPGYVSGAITGATSQGIGAAFAGEDVARAAVTGGVTGGISGGMSAIPAIDRLPGYVSGAITGATSQGIGAAFAGEDVARAALTGGVTGGISGGVSDFREGRGFFGGRNPEFDADLAPGVLQSGDVSGSVPPADSPAPTPAASPAASLLVNQLTPEELADMPPSAGTRGLTLPPSDRVKMPPIPSSVSSPPPAVASQTQAGGFTAPSAGTRGLTLPPSDRVKMPPIPSSVSSPPPAVASQTQEGNILSQVWGNITDRATDPERLTDLAILAGASVLPSLIAGPPPGVPDFAPPENFDVNQMREGLTEEEQWLLDQQIAELQRLYERDEELFVERMNMVRSLLSQAEYFDPDYWGNMAQRNIRSTMARQAREAEREAMLTGRPISETASRQNALNAAIAGETGYLAGADTAARQQMLAITNAMGRLPQTGPQTFGNYTPNITAMTGLGMDRMGSAFDRAKALQDMRMNYFDSQSQDYARRLAALGNTMGTMAGPLLYPRNRGAIR